MDCFVAPLSLMTAPVPPTQRRHTAHAGIQYAAASRLHLSVSGYWMARWSLSSGGAMRRPGGGDDGESVARSSETVIARSEERSNPFFLYAAGWIASRMLPCANASRLSQAMRL